MQDGMNHDVPGSSTRAEPEAGDSMGVVKNDLDAGRLRVGVGDSSFDQEEALRAEHAAEMRRAVEAVIERNGRHRAAALRRLQQRA